MTARDVVERSQIMSCKGPQYSLLPGGFSLLGQPGPLRRDVYVVLGPWPAMPGPVPAMPPLVPLAATPALVDLLHTRLSRSGQPRELFAHGLDGTGTGFFKGRACVAGDARRLFRLRAR